MSNHSHRSGWMKQSNKKHKSRQGFLTKTALKRRNKGKVEAAPQMSVKQSSMKGFVKDTKAKRRNTAAQKRALSREQAIAAKRALYKAPRLVTLLALHGEVDVELLAKRIIVASNPDQNADEITFPFTFYDTKQKCRITLQPSPREQMVALDHARCADMLLLALPAQLSDEAEDEATMDNVSVRSENVRNPVALLRKITGNGLIDATGVTLLSALKSQGLPTCMSCVVGLDSVASHRRGRVRQAVNRVCRYHFGNDIKTFPLDTASDAAMAVRHLGGGGVKAPTWRRRRPYMLPDSVALLSADGEELDAVGVAQRVATCDALTAQDNEESVANASEPGGSIDLSALHSNQSSSTSTRASTTIDTLGGLSGACALRDAIATLRREAENAEMDESVANESHCLLSVTGYVRGARLSVNDLVHITDVGDFQLHAIEAVTDPCPTRKRAVEETEKWQPDEDQDSLQQFNVPDPTLGEQTWPTEEELMEAEEDEKRARGRRLVPAGTSEYQAAWILDDYGYAEDDDEEEDSDDMADDDDDNESGVVDKSILSPGETLVPLDEQERALNPTRAERRKARFGDLTDDDEMADEDEDEEEAPEDVSDDGMNAIERLEQRQLEDALWPDEVDVHPHEEARETFRGWQGLQSFRSSPWDPLQNLPPEYSRVYQFAAFRRTAKAIRRAALRKPIAVGRYVRLYLRVPLRARAPARDIITLLPPNTSLLETKLGMLLDPEAHSAADDGSVSLLLALYAALQKSATSASPLLLSGLLHHERKLSVVHCTLRRHNTYQSPVRNGEQFIFSVGFRRFATRPIFSTADVGVDKHKLERFLQPGVDSVASFYGQVMFPPCPVIAITRSAQGLEDSPDDALVAVGSLMPPNPSRVVLRKAVLTGIPIRTHKRFAIVRGMFHSKEDVEYYKPIELWTKGGHVGHIKESIGLYGRMRCVFDGQVQQNDTVCLSLYARQYPPFPVTVSELRREAALCNAPFVPLYRAGAGHEKEAAIETDDVALPVGFGPIAGGK